MKVAARQGSIAAAAVALMALGAAITTACQGHGDAPPGAQVITVEAVPGAGGGIASVSASAQPMVLRTYRLPEAQAQRAAAALRSVLEGSAVGGDGQPQVGRVSLTAGGQLVVLAPESLHEGVEALVAELLANPTGTTVPPTLAMTYWLVAATPGGAGAALDPALAPIAETLRMLAEGQGTPVGFELLEKVTLVSDEGEQATAGGREALIEQSVWRRSDDTQAEIRIGMLRGPRLETRVRVHDGQTLVLGQVGLEVRAPVSQPQPAATGAAAMGDPSAVTVPSAQVAPSGRRSGTLFYIVQARVLEAPP